MDFIDIKILKILKKNSRKKYVDIANEVNLTEGAVRRRIKKLAMEGTIKKFTIETSTEFEGIVLIKIKSTKTRVITSILEKNTQRVFEVSGDYDIATLIQSYTLEELNKKIDYIRNLSGVLNTKTLIKLKD